MPNQQKIAHIDTPAAAAMVDAMEIDLADGRPVGPLFSDFLQAVSCCKEPQQIYRFEKTDDEPGAAGLLARVLKLFLYEPQATKSDIALALYGVVSHHRWRHNISEYDQLFCLACSVIYASEHLSPFVDGFENIFYFLDDAVTHDEWPFPGHGTLTSGALRDGAPDTLRALCGAAFGDAWWQVANPDTQRLNITEALLAAQPPLINMVNPTLALTLPELTTGQP